MNKKKSQEINDQIKYGLNEIDANRMVSISLKDLLYTYKSLEEFRRYFHQPMHYPTLVELHTFIGDRESGGYSIINDLVTGVLDKYLPEDILEEIEEGDKFNHPDHPYYYQLEKEHRYNLSAAGNTEPPAFEFIKEMGFDVSKRDDIWTAENYNARFNASSPLELLGLITLYQAKGENWKISDNQIDQFIQFEAE